MISELANIAGTLEVGKSCRIDPFVTITGKVKLGDNVHIGVGACIFGSEGVEIGNDCSISPGAKLFTGTFNGETGYLANPQLPNKSYKKGPIKIGKRCIVGANSVVLPNVELGDDVLIGALSLVKKSLNQGMYVGTSARKIK